MRKPVLFNTLIGFVLISNTLLASGSNIYSQKTYLSVRPQGVNAAMEYATWNQHPYAKHGKNIKTHLQATPFYQHSACKEGLGRYFSIGNCKSSFYVNDASLDPTTEVERGLLIHDQASYNVDPHTPGLKGTVQFNPYQEVYGMRIDFFQEITHPFKNIFFRATAPIIQVANDMQMSVCNGTPANTEPCGETSCRKLKCGENGCCCSTDLCQSCYQTCKTNCCKFTLQDFFSGNVSVEAESTNNLQCPLTKGKINDRHSKTGVADFDFGIGYKYLQTDTKFVFFSLDFTIPTGNRPHGEYLFEPIVGNGHHFGLGASLDTGFELWNEKKSTLRLLWITRYRYLFENHEERLLGLKGYNMGHYYLAGFNGQENKPLFPVANELVLPLDVKPGSMFDSMLDLSFNSNHFTIDLGYSLFWKDRETVHIKDVCESKYLVIVPPDYLTSTRIELELVPNGDSSYNCACSCEDIIDVDSAKTPALLTNKVFAGLGYSFTAYKEYLCSFGLGGSYEFATTNADLENYALWLKVDFSF